MSACSGCPVASRSACSASSASPASSTVPAGVVARTTSEPSFTAVPSSGSTCATGCGGPSTSRVRPGQASRRPAASATSGTPAAAASAGDVAQRPRGLADRAHGDRADRPAAQRAREAADVIGVQVAEQHEGDAAHPEAREAGVDRARRPGPASTSTTQPGRAVASTTASPWPTSHATITQPAGGQPGGTSRVGTITTAAPASTASSTARRRRRAGHHRDAAEHARP